MSIETRQPRQQGYLKIGFLKSVVYKHVKIHISLIFSIKTNLVPLSISLFIILQLHLCWKKIVSFCLDRSVITLFIALALSSNLVLASKNNDSCVKCDPSNNGQLR